MDAVFHALADVSRRTVLEELARNEATAGELAALLPIARPGVSRHLRVLRDAGLVEARSEAQRRVYRLRTEGFDQAAHWIAQRQSMWERSLEALHTEVARGHRQQGREPASE